MDGSDEARPARERTSRSSAPLPTPEDKGALTFVAGGRRGERARRLTGPTGLVVELGAAPASARGRIGEILESALEAALHSRGAPPSGVGTGAPPLAVLCDQVLRAQRAGAAPVALVVGSLQAACGPGGVLEPEDSAYLRALAMAARSLPLIVVLDARDQHLSAYAAPVALSELLAGEVVADDGSADATSSPATPPADATPSDAPVSAAPAPSPTPSSRGARRGRTRTSDEDAPPTLRTLPASDAAPTPTPPAPTSAEAAAVERWVDAIRGAQGPQSLAAFERLFVEAYVPLTAALARGVKLPAAVAVHEEFRRTFAQVYTEAFRTFATGRRPRLVLDLPDLAARAARLHGARAAHLLLVDGLRFDAGTLLKTALLGALEGRASLTDELVLWSTLPTSTAPQLDGLARGLEALRAPDGARAEEAVRGRPSEVVRRLRVGPREVFKLDLVEAKLAEAGPAAAAALPAIAGQAAEVIARHVEHLPPRTLLVVFGDHGFLLGEDGRATHGGASPEEVLVPALAFLVGDVH